MYYPPGENDVDYHGMCALPDGRGWVFVTHTAEDYGSLDVLTPNGERKNVVDFDGDSLANPAWSPSGHILFERQEVAAGIWAVPFDIDRLEVTGPPFLVVAGGRAPTVSRDGTLVFATTTSQGLLQLAWYDRQGQFLSTIAELTTLRPYPSLSPDDTKILMAANADSGREIWIFDTTNGNERRLTFDGKDWGVPIWHPDAKHVVSYTEPDYSSYLFTLDGSEPPRELGPAMLSSVANDGRTWFYSKPNLGSGFDFDLYSRDLEAPVEDGRPLVVSPAVEWLPAPRPTGNSCSTSPTETGTQEIYATTYPGLDGAVAGVPGRRRLGDVERRRQADLLQHHEGDLLGLRRPLERLHPGSPGQAHGSPDHGLVPHLDRWLRRHRRRRAVGHAGSHGRERRRRGLPGRGAELVRGIFRLVPAVRPVHWFISLPTRTRGSPPDEIRFASAATSCISGLLIACCNASTDGKGNAKT